jgi:hypothetical protein
MNYIDSGFLGVGQIGQCWNCPLFSAGLCDGDRVQYISLDYEQVISTVRNNPSPRTTERVIDPKYPLPMPECRLNEWVAILKADKYREITIPKGNISLFGKKGFDIATEFYRKAVLAGYRFKNVDLMPFAKHGYFSNGCGNAALFDSKMFVDEESKAKRYLENL